MVVSSSPKQLTDDRALVYSLTGALEIVVVTYMFLVKPGNA
jgi:hypothetical protein